MSTDIWIVDAFTSEPFGGNPAAVCILNAFSDDRILQQIAMEMNLSETAFLVKNGPLHYQLRWFTPTVEVTLCGHATLAATHVLEQSGIAKPRDTVVYQTLSGALSARVLDNGIELDFPALPGKPVSAHPALKALGVKFTACELNRDNYLVEVEDYDTLLECRPDFKALSGMDAQGVIVTCAGVEGFDFASRYFGPNCGVDEDPVTGSSHCFLAPYWAKKLGKQQFKALQASKRQGTLAVTLAGDRVLMTGTAVTTLKGQLQISLSQRKEQAA